MPNPVRTRARVGGSSFSLASIQHDPATGLGDPDNPINPADVQQTDYLPAESNTLKPIQARVTEMAMRASIMAEGEINVPTILTAEGTETFSLNPRLGWNRFQAGIGAFELLPEVTDVSTGDVVTANGLSTIPCSAPGDFALGAGMVVNSGSEMEPCRVEDNTTSLVVSGLKKNAAAAGGITLLQPAQEKYAHSLLTGAAALQYPLLTYEIGVGGEWSWVYPSCFVDALDFTIGTGIAKVAAKIYGTALMIDRDPTTTPPMAIYNPRAADEVMALNPYTGQNGIITLATDPEGTGTAVVRAAVGIKEAKIAWTDILQKEHVIGEEVMLAFAGDKAKLEISYNEIDTAHRPAIFDEYVRFGKGARFSFGYAKNYGTIGAPSYEMSSVSIPYAVYEDSASENKPGTTIQFANKAHGKVVAGLEQDKIVMFRTVGV